MKRHTVVHVCHEMNMTKDMKKCSIYTARDSCGNMATVALFMSAPAVGFFINHTGHALPGQTELVCQSQTSSRSRLTLMAS